MKKLAFVVMAFAAIGLIFSCGPNKAELAEKARQDSIRVADSLKRMEEIAAQKAAQEAAEKAKADSIERDKKVITMIEEFYKNYVFGEKYNDLTKKTVANKYWTKKLARELANLYDYDGEGYAIWEFRSGAQDWGPKDGVTNIEVLGNGKYKVYYSNGFGSEKGSLIVSIAVDGDIIKFDDISDNHWNM